MLGEKRFIEKFKGLLEEKEQIKEIPRQERYANRPNLSEIFKEGTVTDKEIANHLRMHYTTVSKTLKDEENKS